MEAKKGAAAAWVRCPGCSQPVRVESAKIQPPRPPREEILEPASGAIFAPPNVAVAPVVVPPSRQTTAEQIPPRWTPKPRGGIHHIGCVPATLISGMAGFAQVFFVATFLGVRDPMELAGCGLFGFFLAWFTGGIMTSIGNSRSVMWEEHTPRR
jgi:hypothetical protein